MNESFISLQNPKLHKWIFGLMCFYGLALTCSTAGMELGAALLTLTFVAVVTRLKIQRKSLKDLRFQGDIFLCGFFASILLGAFFIPDLSFDDRKEIIRSSRFALTLYALISAFQILFVSKKAEAFLKFLIVCVGLVSVYGAIQFFTGVDLLRSAPYEMTIFGDPNIPLFRVKGFYTNTMTYSYLIGMLFCLATALAWLQGLSFSTSAKGPARLRRYLPAAIAVVALLSLFMTFTRGLWIALIAARNLDPSFGPLTVGHHKFVNCAMAASIAANGIGPAVHSKNVGTKSGQPAHVGNPGLNIVFKIPVS